MYICKHEYTAVYTVGVVVSRLTSVSRPSMASMLLKDRSGRRAWLRGTVLELTPHLLPGRRGGQRLPSVRPAIWDGNSLGVGSVHLGVGKTLEARPPHTPGPIPADLRTLSTPGFSSLGIKLLFPTAVLGFEGVVAATLSWNTDGPKAQSGNFSRALS